MVSFQNLTSSLCSFLLENRLLPSPWQRELNQDRGREDGMTEWLMRKGVLGLKAVGGKGVERGAEGGANDRWGPGEGSYGQWSRDG